MVTLPILSVKQFMDFLYLIFYACLRLRFRDVDTNPGPRCPVPAVCRILGYQQNTLYNTMQNTPRGLDWNLGDLTVAFFSV